MPTEIKQPIPEILAPHVDRLMNDFLTSCQKASINPPEQTSFQKSAYHVFACSDYIAETCLRYPAIILDLFQSGDIECDYTQQSYKEKLTELLNPIQNETELLSTLRFFRRREILRIAWRDLMKWGDFNKIMTELSSLADACIELSLQKLYEWHTQSHGIPKNKEGKQLHLLVLAVGKLGGYELNFSSDVDLIFVYPAIGHTEGTEKTLTNEQFFIRLGQKLIQSLNQLTADGFVFRVDMRLRPFGSSGPLAISLTALRDYYQNQGRDWERYALIKARVVTGGRLAKRKLSSIITNFVYRPYIDFGAIEALREIKSIFSKEIKLKQLEENIKQGLGGIREIEFIAQMPQLIRGGKNSALQTKGLLTTLKRLTQLGFFDSATHEKLSEIYLFLRRTEHRLQMVNDQQTHKLPDTLLNQARLAYAMEFDDWDAFYNQLNEYRGFVHQLFSEETAEPQIVEGEEQAVKTFDLAGLWSGKLPLQAALRMLIKLGFTQGDDVLRILSAFRINAKKQLVSLYARKRLSQIGPRLLYLIGKTDDPETTLKRMIRLLETIMRRSAHIVLLLEKPKALKRLVILCAASPWITNQLASMPSLLDELRDSRTLYAPLDIETLQQELLQHRQTTDLDNLENQMFYLRRFKAAQILRVAAADVTNKLPLMKVSDHLTNTASTILAEVQQIAWHHTTHKYGEPPKELYDKVKENFSVIAYGKLGGIELGYGSDLDLVFLYDDAYPFETISEKPIQASEFYYRLAQLIIHILSNIQTMTGVLYEVDTRLRPSGNAGPLANSLSAFREYQLEEAWTWEHQAIVRARPITGSALMHESFNKIRKEALSKKRDQQKIKTDIISMRQKMRQAAKTPPANYFDLKQGIGGITDIEFIVQYGVLLWAHRHPNVYEYTDNIRILEAFGQEKLVPDKTVTLLCDAYRAYRQKLHLLVLQNQSEYVHDNELVNFRENVQKAWLDVIEAT